MNSWEVTLSVITEVTIVVEAEKEWEARAIVEKGIAPGDVRRLREFLSLHDCDVPTVDFAQIASIDPMEDL